VKREGHVGYDETAEQGSMGTSMNAQVRKTCVERRVHSFKLSLEVVQGGIESSSCDDTMQAET
jgi:hypothetical protein